jgi:hypothetical protein
VCEAAAAVASAPAAIVCVTAPLFPGLAMRTDTFRFCGAVCVVAACAAACAAG